MKTLKVRLTGTNPLLMHSGDMANPFNPKVQFMKQYTKKRGKTEKDLMDLARMEWEAALYLDHGEICLPAECLYKCFIEGARNTKNGKQFEAGVRVATSSVPLTYSGKQIKVEGNTFPNPNLNEVFEEHFNKKGCLQMVTVGTAKTPRCRPVFENWSCEVTLNYNENVIAEDTILTALNDAGMLKGLCDRRPLYGTFEVQVVS